MARSPRPQDISWFLDLYDKGQLNLDPPYQRRSVWSRRDKQFFIDTVMNNLPAPPVFLHKTLDEAGKQTFHVVDGKQRIQTIIEFREDKVRLPDDFSDVALKKKRWRDLDRSKREQFWNYELVVEQIPDVSDASIKNIFERINRNARKLTQQELRHAKYDGWFIKTAESEAEHQIWRDFGLITTARVKRMADVQFISELMILTIQKKIEGFDQDHIDSFYASYEDLDEQPTFIEDDFRKEFNRIKSLIRQTMSIESKAVEFFKVQGHFYTLWAYLLIESDRVPSIEQFTSRYIKFLDNVAETIERLKGEDAPTSAGNSEDYRQAVTSYALNLRGASTDLAPRQARHANLSTIMSLAEPVLDEDS